MEKRVDVCYPPECLTLLFMYLDWHGDLERYKKNCKYYYSNLVSSFDWERSPEGFEYWNWLDDDFREVWMRGKREEL